MCEENALAVLRNQIVLNNLFDKLYSVAGNDNVSEDYRCSFSMIQAAKNKKQTSTGKLLQPNIGAKVVFTVKTDIQDCLINGQVGRFPYVYIAQKCQSKGIC